MKRTCKYCDKIHEGDDVARKNGIKSKTYLDGYCSAKCLIFDKYTKQ